MANSLKIIMSHRVTLSFLILFIINYSFIRAQHPCHHPSQELVSFTTVLKKLGYKSDHQRLFKKGLYGGLNVLQPYSVGQEKFYKPSLPYALLCRYDELHRRSDQPETDILYNPQCIWAYFYRDTIDDNWIEDGVIDEWVFTNATEAEKAYQVMEEISYLMYFNTMPYCYKYKNRVYVLHTRAMAFSFEQKEVYSEFVKHLEEH